MFHHNNAQELDYNKSFPFDVIRYRQVDNYTDQQIRHIVDTVWRSLPFLTNSKKSTKKKYREMVKNYVLNVIKSYQSGYCIRVSRNRNDHHYEERYSHIHTTPSIVINTMDALEGNDWIDLHIGFFDKQRNSGKQTRIFPSQKFIILVEGTDCVMGNKKIRFVKEDAKEVIQLRHKIDKQKYSLVPYKDTPKTIMMRSRLNQYNSFMRRVLTILPLTKKELSEMSSNHKETFNNMMLNGSIVFCDKKMKKGSKVLKKKKKSSLIDQRSNTYRVLECLSTNDTDGEQCTPFGYEESISGGNNPTTDQSIHQEQYSLNTIPNTITTTENHKRERQEKDRKKDIPITKTLAHNNTLNQTHTVDISFSDDDTENAYYSIDQVLRDYPKSRKFWFRIVPQDMFRAFSDSSKTFMHHGRFYSDLVQNLPSWMRTKITMGHEKVVECDYTSIHPTMLYVMAGAVPPKNIYMIDKKTDPQLRKEYKTVLLVSINHKNSDTMWSAVSSNFRKEFGYKAGDKRLTKKYIMGIYDRLLKHNKPIANDMNTGVAMRLMRKDSEIADRIMMEFVSHEIPIRCIHDSFIVPAEYEAELKQLMVEYFQEVMRTDYVIGITTETSSGKAPNAPVLHREPEKVVIADVEDIDTEDDFDDNMKYFEELLHDDLDDLDDIEFPIEGFRRIPDENRFAGIRF